MQTLRLVVLVFFIWNTSAFANGQTGHITAAEAKSHIGERATVCGNVVSIHYATRSKGSPTFLNLDESYPKQIVTILIWGNDRPNFGDPEAQRARLRSIGVSPKLSLNGQGRSRFQNRTCRSVPELPELSGGCV
jgi:hypothetical protein